MRTIVLTSAAARDLDALPAQARHAIEKALAAFAVSGTGDVKRLKGRDGYRLRIGDYRVIFTADRAMILAVYVGRRTITTY